MSHGMDARPIEASDDTPATVKPHGAGDSVLLVSDPEVKEYLGRIAAAVESIETRLRLITGG